MGPMKTTLEGSSTTVTIDPAERVYIIGERINPSPDSKLARSLADGDMAYVQDLARDQVENGADLIDINVDEETIDTREILPKTVEAVSAVVDVPLVLDTNYENVEAIEAALKICPGKPVINSVSGERDSLDRILPLVQEYDTAVIGLTMDADGIPDDPEARLSIARDIVETAEDLGIPRQDVIFDPLALPAASNPDAGLATLRSIELIREELGNSISLGVSNISYELPRRVEINNLFLAMAIRAGLNMPIVDPVKTRQAILISDLLLGRDEYARRFLTFHRES